jgi:hypothetical protein
MLKTNMVAAAGLLLATTFAGAAFADQIDRRQERQDYRIEQGIRDGSLTREEARRLERNQRRIQREEWRAKSDGVLTEHERMRLDAMQDREGRRIARQRRDDDHRWD